MEDKTTTTVSPKGEIVEIVLTQQKIFIYFYKIIACINSCIHEEQLQSVKNSVENFISEFNTHPGLQSFLEELEYQLTLKQNSLPK